MGTHPIFESDFDCLTDCSNLKKWLPSLKKLLSKIEQASDPAVVKKLCPSTLKICSSRKAQFKQILFEVSASIECRWESSFFLYVKNLHLFVPRTVILDFTSVTRMN